MNYIFQFVRVYNYYLNLVLIHYFLHYDHSFFFSIFHNTQEKNIHVTILMTSMLIIILFILITINIIINNDIIFINNDIIIIIKIIIAITIAIIASTITFRSSLVFLSTVTTVTKITFCLNEGDRTIPRVHVRIPFI